MLIVLKGTTTNEGILFSLADKEARSFFVCTKETKMWEKHYQLTSVLFFELINSKATTGKWLFSAAQLM